MTSIAEQTAATFHDEFPLETPSLSWLAEAASIERVSDDDRDVFFDDVTRAVRMLQAKASGARHHAERPDADNLFAPELDADCRAVGLPQDQWPEFQEAVHREWWRLGHEVAPRITTRRRANSTADGYCVQDERDRSDAFYVELAKVREALGGEPLWVRCGVHSSGHLETRDGRIVSVPEAQFPELTKGLAMNYPDLNE